MGKVVSVLPMLVNNLQAQGVFALDIRNKEELEAKMAENRKYRPFRRQIASINFEHLSG